MGKKFFWTKWKFLQFCQKKCFPLVFSLSIKFLRPTHYISLSCPLLLDCMECSFWCFWSRFLKKLTSILLKYAALRNKKAKKRNRSSKMNFFRFWCGLKGKIVKTACALENEKKMRKNEKKLRKNLRKKRLKNRGSREKFFFFFFIKMLLLA